MRRTQLEQIATTLLRDLAVMLNPSLSSNGETSWEVYLQGGRKSKRVLEPEKVKAGLEALLPKAHVYAFPKADLTTDAVVFGINRDSRKLQVLLIERGRVEEPFYGCWALPGGYVDVHTSETIEQGVYRELLEETHLQQVAYLEQLYTFGRPNRDPRGRVISVAYWGCVDPNQVQVTADDDAKNIGWFDVEALPELAFDHAEIVEMAVERLRGKLRWQPVGCWLLPALFTLRELQDVYEIILGRDLDTRLFRRKVQPHIDIGVLVGTASKRKLVTGRPAQLYRFDPDKYEKLRADGLRFEV